MKWESWIINIVSMGTWNISKRHRYNGTLPKGSYLHNGRKENDLVENGTKKKRWTWHKGILGRKRDDIRKYDEKIKENENTIMRRTQTLQNVY